ncbi:putative phosphoesterase [Paraburkholderia bannensis]|uniref:Putative phosphoesterase n=1 Tax=Paraburkholderia bannensis TaxID=765414 RepID=A0A7W9WX17_9BURK|nr:MULTISPECIES: metallophosphoesterase family protein [Paraburkholderia]MBB3262323.1 putative phosphoesterase [Paraburkholderia sp. WP4_3_2]MBB6107231.1 putative phosphoesterase [Paraburkholderia bannensis]
MKIAAISDIHGNLAALDAVLADIRSQGVDLIVNLGDILSGALYPSQTADRLMALRLPTIKGNHERQLLAGEPSRMGPSDRFAHHALREDQRAWLRELPATLRPADDVLLVHGTPSSDLDYFLETVTPGGCRVATRAEVASRAGDAQAALILCGHTHLQRSMRLDDGRLIVNPGSVGLPAYEDDHPFPHRMEAGSQHARYAIVTKHASHWNAEFRAVDYDWNEAAKVAASNERPEWERALRTGFC